VILKISPNYSRGVKIYDLSPDARAVLCPPGVPEYFDGRPVAHLWIDPDFKIATKNGTLNDMIYWFSGPDSVCSERALKAFEPFLEHVEVIPLGPIRGVEFFFLNATYFEEDLIDPEETYRLRARTNHNVLDHSFAVRSLWKPRYHIFRITGRLGDTFVTEEVRSAGEQAKLKGVAFYDVSEPNSLNFFRSLGQPSKSRKAKK
jgi:hypothetical protein